MGRKKERPTGVVPAADSAEHEPLSPVDGLIQRGLAAIGEYDYEAARAALAHAFELSGGAESAARALLVLLVDHLAAYQEALELGDRLSRAVLAAPAVQLVLGLAAARSGAPQRARAHVARLDGAAAAEVLAVLAEAALAAGELDAAAGLCDEIRTNDRSHPSVQPLARRLAQAREDLRRPGEAAIEQAIAEGRSEDAGRLAERLLASFPESAPARRAVQAAREQMLADKAERLVSAAEEALACGDLGVLPSRLHAARTAAAAAPADQALALRLTALELDLAARERDARARDAQARLADGDPRSGLTHYVSLTSDVRRRVREVAGLPILDDLERLLVERRADRADVVAAALALGEAAAIADSDPEGALQRLAPHERTLVGLGAATRLAARLRQRLRDERRRKLSELLAGARATLDAGDAAAALELLGKGASRELEPGERETVEALRAEAKAAFETHESEVSYERLLSAGDPLAAREIAEQLLARAGPAEQDRRRDQVAAARAAARRAFGVWASQVDDDGTAGREASPSTIDLIAPMNTTTSTRSSASWLDAAGRSLVLLECHDHWAFLQVIDLVARRVRSFAVFRTPERFDDLRAALAPDGVLTMASHRGVLQVSPETWEPLAWSSCRTFGLDGAFESFVVTPDGRFLWAQSFRVFGDAGRARVVDLARRRVVRELSDGQRFWPLAGACEPTMALSRRDTTLSLHQSNGMLMDGVRIELPTSVWHAVIHPSGEGWLVFLGEGGKLSKDSLRLGFMEIDATGRSSTPTWLADWSSGRSCFFATSLAQRTSFVVTRKDDQPVSIQALRAAPSLPVSQVYRASAPAGLQMALDPGSRHVLALVPDHERVHVAPLGQEPPDFPPCEPVLEFLHVPGFDMGCTFCVAIEAEGQATARQLHASPERSATVWMERQIAASGGDIAELLKIHTVLIVAFLPSVREKFLGWLQTNRPSDPHLAALRAQEHAQAQRWDEVRSSLEGVELGALLPEYRRHAHHILGLALLRAGELARALDVLEAGRSATTGHCRLDELLAVLRPLRDDGDPSSPLGRLRAAIHEADAGLLCDDLPAARAAIDRRIVWQSGEVQSLARLAEVELRAEPDCAAGRFRKALALARFLDAHRAIVSRKDLPVPGTAWAAPRIAELEQRAQVWLDRLGAPEPTPDEVSPPVVEDPPVAPPPAWQLALREFDAVMGGESPRVPARLAFRVRHSGRRFEAIDVLLQRQLRNGRFSPGQLTDVGEVLAAAVALGEDADAAAVVVLTEGIPQTPRSRLAPSRARMLRLLAALVGHPRVFLADRPAEPVSVRQACMGLEFVDATGGLVPRFVLGGARWTADELLAHVDLSVVVDVDAQAGSVTLAPLDAAVLALVEAFQRHQPAFPEESHRELRRRLGALQHAVELLLPDDLAGEVRGADSRPVVRLTPEGDAGLLVEIGVRPVPEAVFGPPGEGSRLALGAVDGVHVSARRDLARERASAERVAALPAFAGATRERRWCYRTSGEAQSLAVVEALTELGDEVVVEWPRGVRAWRWVGRATPGNLRVRISRGNDLLQIEGGVEIDEHRVALAALLEAVVHGRRYVAIGPQEFLGLAADLCERLAVAGPLIHAGRGGLEAGVSAAPALADLEADPLSADAAWCSLRERATAARAFEPILPAGLRADLRPYQFEGFRWLARLSAWAPGACLADDMGLGKTVQALALLVHRAALGPALVIAPISVTPGWISEAARFAPGLRVLPYRGADRDALLVDTRPGDLVVAGYGVVTRDADALANVRFATLLLDEAHAIKNAATRRAQAVGRLQADFRVALTGTPVENHLAELWSLFRVISPGLLGTGPQFRERFVVPIERDQSAERHATLGRVLRPFILRRTKESVLPELPPLIELDRLVSLSNTELELYATTRLAAATAITGARTPKERADVLGWLTRLRRLACHPRMVRKAWTGTSSKLDAFMAVVDELRATGHRALVFSQFTDHLALVREALVARGISTVYLDGDTSLDERARAVESFQRGVGDLFLISLKAGGTGLNLTAADHVIHLDPWWNPAVEDQATDRAHRIGQSRPVTVIRLIAQGTIEEAVLALHAEKRDLAERLLAGTDVVARLSAEDLIELVRHGIMTASPVESTDEDEPEANTIPALRRHS